MENTAPAIVLDGDQRSALAAVRSLGKHGVNVLVAEKRRKSLASSSRYCSASLVYPDPSSSPNAFSEWLEATARENHGSVLMPMTDLTTPLVLKAGDRLTTLKTALPSLATYEEASDKYKLYELAKRVGIRVPETIIISRANLQELEDRAFQFPVVIKPRQSAVRRDSAVVKRTVRYARDRSELRVIASNELIDDRDELLLQEYVSGFGAGVFAFYAHGEPMLFFAHKRIREKPPSGGISVLCESTPAHPEALRAAQNILGGLSWHGVAMVEFKIDSEGRAWLIEVNARFWGSLQLAIDSGADFPWLTYQLATGQAPDVAPDYLMGRRLRWWLGDLDNLYARLRHTRWTPSMWHKCRALGEFLNPWQTNTRYEFFRWDDPKPAFSALAEYMRTTIGLQESR